MPLFDFPLCLLQFACHVNRFISLLADCLLGLLEYFVRVVATQDIDRMHQFMPASVADKVQDLYMLFGALLNAALAPFWCWVSVQVVGDAVMGSGPTTDHLTHEAPALCGPAQGNNLNVRVVEALGGYHDVHEELEAALCKL